jgi:D-alanine-D-alanine ligase-like ATP-grasp enzyme
MGSALEVGLLRAASRGGGAGRAWASRLDLVRSVGLRYALHRRREQARENEIGRPALERFYRDAWADAAAELGGELTELDSGFLEIRRGELSTRVWRQLSALDDAVSLRLALDKTVVHRVLAERGITVPDHAELDYTDAAGAMSFIRGTGGPCVVKPANHGRGGAGVTGCVQSERHLARATLSAARLDTRLLVERQIPGEMYRLLYLDGELLDVVLRQAPHVHGDGRSTILELIVSENERRLASGRPRSLITVDLDCLLALEAGGRSPSTVPAAGDAVRVKTASSENGEEENHTMRSFSPDVIEECAEAVRAVGLRLSGVDLVTPDINRPIAEAGGAIIEVNGTPGFQYHYEVADREHATRIAVPVLQRVFEEVGAANTA